MILNRIAKNRSRRVHEWWTDTLVVVRGVLVGGTFAVAVQACGGLRTICAILAGFWIYDILVAHAAHLLDPRVGAPGVDTRVSARRTLMLALFNSAILTVAFAALFATVAQGDVGWMRALSLSLSAMTTLGISTPMSESGKVLAGAEVIVAIFMLTIVLSIAVSGFTPPRESAGEEPDLQLDFDV